MHQVDIGTFLPTSHNGNRQESHTYSVKNILRLLQNIIRLLQFLFSYIAIFIGLIKSNILSYTVVLKLQFLYSLPKYCDVHLPNPTNSWKTSIHFLV